MAYSRWCLVFDVLVAVTMGRALREWIGWWWCGNVVMEDRWRSLECRGGGIHAVVVAMILNPAIIMIPTSTTVYDIILLLAALVAVSVESRMYD